MPRSRSLILPLLAAVVLNCGGLVFDPTPGTVSDEDGRSTRDAGIADANANANGIDGGRSKDAGTRDASPGAKPDASPAACGDGVVTAGERCDDGNATSGDGCSSACVLEPGWSCFGAPTVCETVCGDGLVVGSELCDNQSTCPGTCVRSAWSRTFGDQWYKFPSGLAADATGSTIVTGTFTQNLAFGSASHTSAGSNDIFLVKLDSNGNAVWSRRFGGTGDDRSTFVTTDASGNIFVTGVMSGTVDFGGGPLVTDGTWDVFVLKLDPNGNHVFSKRFGNMNQQEGHSIAIDNAGNLLLAGMAWGSIDFGGGPLTSSDHVGFVAKLDPAGNHIWSKQVAASVRSSVGRIAAGPAGEVFVSGSTEGTTDLGEGPVPGYGERDGFLVALDANGQYRWSRKWGAINSYQSGGALAVDSAGDLLVAASATGPSDLGTGVLGQNGLLDIVVGKFSSTGTPIYSRRFGSARNDVPLAIATDGSNNVFVTGYHSAPMTFGSSTLPFAGGSENTFVFELDPSGTPLWSKSFSSSSRARSAGIAVDPLGSVLVTGEFLEGVTIEGTRYPGYGVYVAKLTP